MNLDKAQITNITRIALMSVLVFLATYLIKIPSLNGYIHIGDSLIFLSVYFLGVKKGALASSIGASLADLLGGYIIWILPTFIIKYLMSIIMGVISLKILKNHKIRFILGCTLGGIVQVILYTIVNIAIYGSGGIFASITGDLIQTLVGTILFLGIIYFIEVSGLERLLKK